MHSRRFLMAGAILLALAVIFGAFGTHALKTILSSARFETYQIAVEYQVWQALGLLAVGLSAERLSTRLWILAGYLILVGTVVFSGSLYLLIALDMTILGAITPMGGIMMISGWVVFAWSLRRFKSAI